MKDNGFKERFNEASKDLAPHLKELFLLMSAVRFLETGDPVLEECVCRLKAIADDASKWQGFTKGNGGAN